MDRSAKGLALPPFRHLKETLWHAVYNCQDTHRSSGEAELALLGVFFVRWVPGN